MNAGAGSYASAEAANASPLQNLPTVAANAGANIFGIEVNIGFGNTGTGNTGTGNIGIGNTGNNTRRE